MSAQQRFTNEQIIAAYKATGSVWKAAKNIGACGQSVWERLKRLGYEMPNQKWSEAEIAELEALAPACTVGEIARRLGRSYPAVACKVSEKGIGVRYGNNLQRKSIRGSGLTKSATSNLVKQLSNYGGSIKSFAVQRGLDLESLVAAIQRYQPEYWTGYVRQHSELSPMTCPQCAMEFVPLTKKQTCCSRRCSSLRRVDQKYFGGKRTNAIGLLEGICQLCEKEKKSLSAHHIFGKENDTENDFLIALCRGCHQLVGHLGNRSDANSPSFWENLIGLASARKNGHRNPSGFRVYVDIEELTLEQVESEDSNG